MKLFQIILLILTALLWTRSSPAKSFILMEVGEQKRIPSPASEDIAVHPGGLISIQEKDTGFKITARKKGLVFIEHGPHTKTIYILSSSSKQSWQAFIRMIDKIPWLSWSFSDETIHIKGDLKFFQNWQKLKQLSKKIPYRMEAALSPSAKKEALAFFKTKQDDNFRVEWGPPVKAHVSSEDMALFFESYGILTQKIENKTPPLVEVHLLITQMSSQLARSLHIQNTSSLLNLSIEELMNTLKLNQSQGHVKASSKILIESGREGRFLIGGESPVHQFSPKLESKSIQWKPYGLSIRLTPLVKNQKVKNQKIKNQNVKNQKIIFMKYSVEVSEIDPAHSTEGSPASKTHRLSSEIHIPDQKTFCLSHLERSQKGSGAGLPFGLSGWPLISSFLFKKGATQKNTKAFIFITPRLLGRSAPATAPRTPGLQDSPANPLGEGGVGGDRPKGGIGRQKTGRSAPKEGP